MYLLLFFAKNVMIVKSIYMNYKKLNCLENYLWGVLYPAEELAEEGGPIKNLGFVRMTGDDSWDDVIDPLWGSLKL